MKKIYSLILAAIALFTIQFVTNAQPYTEKDHIAYSKYPTGPVNGIYTIHLDTFVTGEKTVSKSSLPSDVVLVLDVSGSMNESYTSYSYTSRGEQSYSPNDIRYGGYYYHHTDGKYYKVSRGGNNRNRNIYFDDGITRYYLVGTEVSATAPTGYGGDTDIWTGVLYSRQANSTTRIAALKEAVNGFIDVIHEMDPGEEGKHNQISIVKFANAAYFDNESSSDATGNHKFSGYTAESGSTMEPGNPNFSSTYYYNLTEIVKGFIEVTGNGVSDLKAAVNALQPGGGTASDYGMKKALALVNTLYDAKTGSPKRQSNKTIVFFTDGVPTHEYYYQKNVAETAIQSAASIKSKIAYHDDEQKEDVNVSVYSVGVFGSMDDTRMTVTQRETYMHRISSDYPNASGMDYNEEGTDGSDSEGFYQDASDADLSSIFRSIATASGGSKATTVTAEAATTVDVVSQSFDLPYGADPNSISVHFANCTGVDENGYLTFDEENLIDNPAKGEDGHVTITIDEDSQKITATGFEYSGNWCGKDETLGENEYHGMKLMLEIPIEMSDDAVGGNQVGTNGPESGIYVDGKPVLIFDVPHIDLPTNLHIKKVIANGECATFEIYRKKNQEGANWETKPFKTVMVIGGNNDNTVKLMGLDPHYLYKIVEAGWSWTYDLDHVEDKDGNIIEGDVTSDKLELNPFIFVNKKKDRQIRNAESAVYNDFRTAGKVEGIDSKGSSSTSGSGNSQGGNTN